MKNIENYQIKPQDKPTLSLEKQLALDLQNYLNQFPNEKFAMRIVSQETGLNQKTIKRLLNCENKPTHQTLLKLYALFFQLDDYQEVLKKVPFVIKERIQNYSPDEEVLGKKRKCQTGLLEMLKNEPLASELVILAALMPIQMSTICFRYGDYGLKVLKQLKNAGILVEQEKDCYIMAPQGPEFDAECLKLLGLHFTQRFSKTSQAKVHNLNILSFYAECLNEKGKQEWLKVDTESFYKKVEIAKSPENKGTIPMFTFTTTDTISLESK